MMATAIGAMDNGRSKWILKSERGKFRKERRRKGGQRVSHMKGALDQIDLCIFIFILVSYSLFLLLFFF